MDYFKDFRSNEYLKLNTTSEVRLLIQKISNDLLNGPFLTNDISELIFQHYRYLNKDSDQKEIKEIIVDAIRFFKKGNSDEIFESLSNKLLNR